MYYSKFNKNAVQVKVKLMIVFILFAVETFAQNSIIKRCGTLEYMQHQLQKNPDWKSKLQAFNSSYDSIEGHTKQKMAMTVNTFNVVVHIVYNKASQNISENQIRSQIDVLNEDFSGTNTDRSIVPSIWKSLRVQTQFRFCLAKIDPQGDSTNGITRTQTSETEFYLDDAMKYDSTGGINAWPTDQYLNIWVCNLGGGVLGYAQLPFGNINTDGVVIRFDAFGRTANLVPPYNKGRTSTHEVGHWLNLSHIWGDDGDGNTGNNNTTAYCSGTDHVGDTPNCSEETYGAPNFPQLDGCATNSPGKMFYNYMDYTDDNHMVMFTLKQNDRMELAFTNAHSGTITLAECTDSAIIINPPESMVPGVEFFPNPVYGIFYVHSNLKYSLMEIAISNMLGQQVFTQTYYGIIDGASIPVNLYNLTNGVYSVAVKADAEYFKSKILLVAN